MSESLWLVFTGGQEVVRIVGRIALKAAEEIPIIAIEILWHFFVKIMVVPNLVLVGDSIWIVFPDSVFI